MIEMKEADDWLYTVLNSSPGLASISGRIYNEGGPQEAVYPFIVYHMSEGRDLMGIGATRVWTTMNYVVRAVTRDGSYESIYGLANAIDAALHDKSHQATENGEVIASVRIAPFKMAETLDGVNYRHLGGIYQLHAKSN